MYHFVDAEVPACRGPGVFLVNMMGHQFAYSFVPIHDATRGGGGGAILEFVADGDGESSLLVSRLLLINQPFNFPRVSHYRWLID